MAAAPSDIQRRNDHWSLFLRQRRLADRLRRLRNDFKDCHCQPGCRGGPQNHVPADPASLPGQPLHGPYVAADSPMPQTRARPQARREPGCRVLAEARGTSDMVLHREGARATLRMSLQVITDPHVAERRGYFAEMFLTRHGQPEQFIGFIHSWHIARTSARWQEVLLPVDGSGDDLPGDDAPGDLKEMQTFFTRVYAMDEEPRVLDRNGNLRPREVHWHSFAAPWARLSDNNDVIYIQIIWLTDEVQGQRIVDQGFNLFYRLMTGGTLPSPYNLGGPLSVLLEPGVLGPPYRNSWVSSTTGEELDVDTRITAVLRVYQRNGFMQFNTSLDEDGDRDLTMGRRVDPQDHPAASGDVAITPPDPPESDHSTPSPERAQRHWVHPKSPESLLESSHEEDDDLVGDDGYYN